MSGALIELTAYGCCCLKAKMINNPHFSFFEHTMPPMDSEIILEDTNNQIPTFQYVATDMDKVLPFPELFRANIHEPVSKELYGGNQYTLF
jgi:hypothetical protein